MNTGIIRLIAASALCVTAVLSAQVLQAQAVFNNPPCASILVSNLNPTCNAQINLITVPAFVLPGFYLAAATSTTLPLPLGATQVVGMIPPGPPGTPAVRFLPPPAPFGPCGPTAWWATNVPLDPLNPACLFNVCVDPASCSIRVF